MVSAFVTCYVFLSLFFGVSWLSFSFSLERILSVEIVEIALLIVCRAILIAVCRAWDIKFTLAFELSYHGILIWGTQ